MTRQSFVSVLIVIASIIFAWWLGESGAILWFLSLPLPTPVVSFIAGFFFTSVFTTAPAVVLLGAIATHGALWPVIVWGALGAVIGDTIIITMMSRIVGNIHGIHFPLPHFLKLQEIKHAFSHGPARILLWITGALIIASPFPDEPGLALLGLAHLPIRYFVALSFFLNALGILAIAMVARVM
jgi:hypothetical protein